MAQKSNLTISNVLESMQANQVLYEIKGDTVYFGYDSIGSSFFFDKELQKRLDNPRIDFLKVVRAIFLFFDIKTINPGSIWAKCRINKDKKLIQIIEIDSKGSRSTRKLCSIFLENLANFDYGFFSILKNPITLKWESYATDMSFLLENFESLDKNISLLSKSDKKKFFQFLEKSLVLNGKTKLDGFNVLDCRSFLIKSHIEKLRLFR
jgi:hypothetical protein